MAKLLIFLFLIVAVSFVQSRIPPNKPCCSGKNEIYKPCGGCDGCCWNPVPCCGDAKGPPGCYCIDGYVRNQSGQCVKICDCEQCECHEVWRCGNCDRSWDNPSGKCCCACRWGCFCEDGYIRDEHGDCVPEKKCIHHDSGEHNKHDD